MFHNSDVQLAKGFRRLAALTACCIALHAAVPEGWMLAGGNPKNYETDIDSGVLYRGHASAYLRAIKADAPGFGTLMQDFGAEQYKGKRVRFTAFVKADQVQQWAGLWMRVDKGSVPVNFDNMMGRPIKGTSDWASYSVVLDVPKDATLIAFGILLAGAGTVWTNDAAFEVVTNDVPTTGEAKHDGPTNLGFENR